MNDLNSFFFLVCAMSTVCVVCYYCGDDFTLDKLTHHQLLQNRPGILPYIVGAAAAGYVHYPRTDEIMPSDEEPLRQFRRQLKVDALVDFKYGEA